MLERYISRNESESLGIKWPPTKLRAVFSGITSKGRKYYCDASFISISDVTPDLVFLEMKTIYEYKTQDTYYLSPINMAQKSMLLHEQRISVARQIIRSKNKIGLRNLKSKIQEIIQD
jgi:hypothetical protein